MEDVEESGRWEKFTNPTGQQVPNMIVSLEYALPGKSYQSGPTSKKQNHSLFHYARKIAFKSMGLQLSQLLGFLQLGPQPSSLHSEFSQSSLAILTNSVDLEQAVWKAKGYNIPLIQAVIRTPEGKETIKEKVLFNFAVGHLLNQNFVFYGDYESREEFSKCARWVQPEPFHQTEGLYFRRGELVYGFIPMWKLDAANENIIQENLLQIRNEYYTLELEKPRQKEEEDNAFSSEVSSIIDPNPSYFGAMGLNEAERQHRNDRQAQEQFEENFIDSDHEDGMM